MKPLHIQPEFYESEYNQYYEDAVFDNPELAAFAPEIIYIHTSFRNITALPKISDDPGNVEKLFESEMQKFRSAWDHLFESYHCPVIQNNFEYPFYRLMGNKDASDIHGAVNFVTRLNMGFYEYAQSHENFYICDINYLSAAYGLDAWSDPFYWHMYKYALCVPAIPTLAHNVANIIKSIFGKNKKGMVLDLDNTLWGGIIGDDGVDNIKLGPEESEGQAYIEFQSYLKAHKQLGVILNVNSKNEYENAIAGLEHPNSLLRPEEFVCIKANWEPKDINFTQIASDLNLLPESLVFIDDNPAERAIVTAQLPGVVAPELDRPENYIKRIDGAGFFEVTNLSKDDLKRNEMYQENIKRAKLEASYESYTDYLLSLEMRAAIRPFESIYFARIAQLTNKSNQFNLTTRRYTQSEIEQLAESAEYVTLYGKLEDKFGDNGVVSVVIGRLDGETCHIDLWIMSCRVLKRDMEYAMMDTLVKILRERGVKQIIGYYYPTAKNKMVQNFYGLHGFVKEKEDHQGNTEWCCTISEYENKNFVIEVND